MEKAVSLPKKRTVVEKEISFGREQRSFFIEDSTLSATINKEVAPLAADEGSKQERRQSDFIKLENRE